MVQKIQGSISHLTVLITVMFFSPLAQADWQIMPKNSHQLYETYGLFIDEQTTVAYYGAARAWGALAGTIPLLGNPDSEMHPQLLLHSSVNAAMRFEESGRILTDEFDVRVGLAYEFALNPVFRLSLGFTHYSGHVAEGFVDRDLLEPNLGDNAFVGRIVYDLGLFARAGVTFKPIINGGPPFNFFAADEFVEFFPFSALDDSQRPSPYIAIGMEQGGTDQFGIANVFHAQIGAYVGNHFSNEHRQTVRVVLGYYTGADPRLKYFQYKDKRDSFGYAGFMADF